MIYSHNRNLFEEILSFQFVSSTSLMFYIAQTFDMFSGLRVLILRSTISTFVEVDEVGRTFSIIAIIEALSLFLITYGYSEIYGQTLKTWPAAIYLGTLLIMIVCALCFTWVHTDLIRCIGATNGDRLDYVVLFIHRSLYFLLKDGIQRNEQAQFEAENEVKSTANDEITSVWKLDDDSECVKLKTLLSTDANKKKWKSGPRKASPVFSTRIHRIENSRFDSVGGKHISAESEKPKAELPFFISQFAHCPWLNVDWQSQLILRCEHSWWILRLPVDVSIADDRLIFCSQISQSCSMAVRA